jgi:aspartate-semialdehyde dehydrogenase
MQKKDKYKVAILGATGNVGRIMLDILEERNFPCESITCLASERSVGQEILSQKGKRYTVRLAEPKAFDGIDIVFASAGSKVSAELAPEIVKRGGVIIDNSSYFRMHEEVPLVVPEVNREDLYKHKGIIANPNCSTAPLVILLKPLDQAFGIKRVVVSTYQSVSGAGKSAMDELRETSMHSLQGKDFENKAMNQKIAFNLIPHIDAFQPNAYTKEELKVVNESRKMLGKPDLRLTCTAVRVPVFISHSASVNVELERKTSPDELRQVLMRAPEINIIDNPSKNEYPMPLYAAGTDPVHVGRIREDESQPNTFNMWIVSDNLRIGAALNAVRIGEALIKN